MEEFIIHFESPIGILEIKGNEEGIGSIRYNEDIAPHDLRTKTPDCLQACVKQLEEYFSGSRTEFTLLLNPEGTDFHKKVWDKLLSVRYGETISYQLLAHQLKNPKAIRAVGTANGRNPHPIIVPCHRVIGLDGKLTGYMGGLWRKKWLLNHEKKVKFGGVDLFDQEFF